jgi:hypothetical protein
MGQLPTFKRTLICAAFGPKLGQRTGKRWIQLGAGTFSISTYGEALRISLVLWAKALVASTVASRGCGKRLAGSRFSDRFAMWSN